MSDRFQFLDVDATALTDASRCARHGCVCLDTAQAHAGESTNRGSGADRQDLLYVLLIAGGHIVTLLRPRKHAIHPSGERVSSPYAMCSDDADLHLLLNTLATSESIRSTETWIPICFPKFNPAGYVHAFISYDTPDIGLVFVSADREAFEELRAWKATVVEALEKNNVMNRIAEALPLHECSVCKSIPCSGDCVLTDHISRPGVPGPPALHVSLKDPRPGDQSSLGGTVRR